MNKDNAKDYLPLVQALAEGKTIQVNYTGDWGDEYNLDFSLPLEHYRVKPEPRELTVCLCKRYEPFKIQEMKCNDCEGCGNCEIIKVREVLDNE